MTKIDLNCDLGESFGAWKMGLDEEVMPYITSANVACGWHAGDPLVMSRTVSLAKKYGVGVGAHTGYPDLLGFGRRTMDCSYDELKNYMIYQMGALDAFCKIHGVKLTHVKPHGRMYLDALEREEQARALADAIVSFNPELFYVAFAGARGKLVGEVGNEAGLKVVYEVFPERGYTPEGFLAPRKEPGAVIQDPQQVAETALRVATEQKLIAMDGTEIPVHAQTLCVHGDNPKAVNLVRTIRETLKEAGIDVVPMGSFLQ